MVATERYDNDMEARPRTQIRIFANILLDGVVDVARGFEKSFLSEFGFFSERNASLEKFAELRNRKEGEFSRVVGYYEGFGIKFSEAEKTEFLRAEVRN